MKKSDIYQPLVRELSMGVVPARFFLDLSFIESQRMFYGMFIDAVNWESSNGMSMGFSIQFDEKMFIGFESPIASPTFNLGKCMEM